jgi:hypothetical protein
MFIFNKFLITSLLFKSLNFKFIYLPKSSLFDSINLGISYAFIIIHKYKRFMELIGHGAEAKVFKVITEI